jgi:hypothetical protein
VIRALGQWSGTGINNQAHQWMELTDTGLSAPQVVNFNGVGTLRVSTSTGNVYPNYFMLVPASGIRISASKQGASPAISFPTQSGVVYRIFYRNSLTTGNWALLTTVLGTGGVKSVAISPTSSVQFYKVVAP